MTYDIPLVPWEFILQSHTSSLALQHFRLSSLSLNALQKKRKEQEGSTLPPSSSCFSSWEPQPYADSGSCSGWKNNSNTVAAYFQHEILYTSTELSMEL